VVTFFAVITIIGFWHEMPKGQWMTTPDARRALLACLPAALIPASIIGGILFGIATPTESAAIASLIAFLIGWLGYREIAPAKLGQLFARTAKNASMVIFMIAAANVFGWVIMYEALPQKLAALVTAITSDPFTFLLIVNLVLLAVGMLIDGIAALILVTPILLPIAMNNYDIDPFHFGVVMSLNLVLGLLTPPVGVGLYIASAMSGSASISWMFSVTPGSAISRTCVASNPVPASATAAATLAFFGYPNAASRAVPSKCAVASVNASRSNTASAGDPRQPPGGLRPVYCTRESPPTAPAATASSTPIAPVAK